MHVSPNEICIFIYLLYRRSANNQISFCDSMSSRSTIDVVEDGLAVPIQVLRSPVEESIPIFVAEENFTKTTSTHPYEVYLIPS